MVLHYKTWYKKDPSPFTLPRPPSALSVSSVTSIRSAESVLTTRSLPVRGATAQRTTRKPAGANASFVSKAPGIRLSVEYSEETSLLKIRVWSVQYVTIPANTAAINSSTHIRCCVFPGNKIWSKTEDIPIEKFLPKKDAESGVSNKTREFDQPITLQPVPMDRKMTFKSITETELSEKNLEIVLCCKTPTKISSKVHHIAKLFLKCDEAVNLVMPKWFLMTTCSIDKTSPVTPHVTSSSRTAHVQNPRAAHVQSLRAGPTFSRHSSQESVTSGDSSLCSTPDLQFRNPNFGSSSSLPRPGSAGSQGRNDPPLLSSPSIVSNTNSVLSVSYVKITEPVSIAPPPINKISSSIPMGNPFRRDRKNHAKAVTSPECVTSREKEFETRIEMNELDLKKANEGEGKHNRPRIKHRAGALMNEIV